MGAVVWAVVWAVNLPMNQRQSKKMKLSLANVCGRVGTQALELVIVSSQVSNQLLSQGSGKTSQRFELFYRCLYQRHCSDQSIGTGRIESFGVPTIGYGGRIP